MTEREQFEAWWNEAAYTSDTLAKHEQNIAWCAWQAARAAAPAEPVAFIWHIHQGEGTKSLRWHKPSQWEYATKVEPLYASPPRSAE